MNQDLLREYARLIAVSGVNVQKGQDVIVRSSVENAAFAAMVVEECYKAGAGDVRVDWSYMPIAKMHYEYQTAESLGSMRKWEIAREEDRVERLPARISIVGDDPDGLKGVDREKMQKVNILRYPIIKPFIQASENKYQWCVCAVPSVKWAKKVLPELSEEEAVEKLWDAILHCSRVDGNSVENWKAHDENIARICKKLNAYNFKSMHYTAANGTDLTVGLIPNYGSFAGGSCDTLQGVTYNANIPTEEVFTTPKFGEAEGIVYASKPLSYGGELIENFWLRFAGGKVVDMGAETNLHVLEKMVTTDEGASMLGECALVPYESPINQTGLIFYNTLFDENACCHIALGNGYTETIRGFEKMTGEEMHALGVNESMIHVDFMIGTADMRVTATTVDGEEISIFENGTWSL